MRSIICLVVVCLALALMVGVAVAQSPGLMMLRRSTGAVGTSGPPPQTISSIAPTSCLIPTGATATCATMAVTMSPTTPAFAGSLSVGTSGGGCTDTTAGNFAMSGANLNLTNASIAAGSYTGCVTATQTGISNSPFVQAVAITVTAATTVNFLANTGTRYQTVDGFGGSDAAMGPYSSAEIDGFYCVNATDTGCSNAGIGMTLLRVGSGSEGYAVPDGVAVHARGGTVWMTPWSIGPCCGNPGQINPGDSSTWQSGITAYLNSAAAFVNGGAPIYALETQNEPDCGCNGGQGWNTAQTVQMIDTLGPQAHSAGYKFMSPEVAFPASSYANYVQAIEADSTANAQTDIFTYHQYSSSIPSIANDNTRHVWETEVSNDDSGANDPSINNAVNSTSQWIYDAMVSFSANAWHFWWLDQIVSDTSTSGSNGLLTNGNPNKRYFAVGNWSRFVRPGWVRVDVGGTGASGFYGVAAFVSPSGPSGGFAIIAINNSGSTINNVTFGINGATISGTVAPWVTSGTAIGGLGTDGNLSNGSSSGGIPTSITPSGNVWTASVPYGIETFVGKTN